MKTQGIILALALVACGKSDKKPGENADPVENKAGGDPSGATGAQPTPSGFDCKTLLSAADVEAACGAKGTVDKMAGEGETQSVGTAKLQHVCYREIKLGPDSHVTVAVNWVTGSQSAEDIVRANMETAGAGGWGKSVEGMTGYVGMPPSTDATRENLELRGLVRGTMIELLTSHKAGEPWACNDAGLKALAKLLADRVPAAPSRE